MDDEETRVAVSDEETEVHAKPLFCLRVSQEGQAGPSLHRFFKPEVSIGRGGKSVPVDLALSEDREISRLHAVVRRTPDGFVVIMKGKNPILVGGREIHPGEEQAVGLSEPIQIGKYQLTLAEE
jgi:predicted component of type VI protein secretion system